MGVRPSFFVVRLPDVAAILNKGGSMLRSASDGMVLLSAEVSDLDTATSWLKEK